MEFLQPGKLDYRRIPLADVVAFFWHLPRWLLAELTGRAAPTQPPSPGVVTAEDPLYNLVKANVLLERDDSELVDEIHRSIDAALCLLPRLSDLAYVLPPDTRDDTVVAYVLLRAPVGSDPHAADGDALDAVIEALRATEALPGVVLIEYGIGDM
jgi:hypothetical protein